VIDFIWDLCQQSQISRIRSRAADAELAAKHAESRGLEHQQHLRALEQQVDRLTLTVTALCEHMIASGSITAGKLQGLIDEIDLRDGRLDGRMRASPVRCPSCSHETHPKRTTCLYCGAELQTTSSPK
jgi:hypothetical protein